MDMSVIQSLKETIGIGEQPPEYECQDCGHTFRTEADPDSRWYSCPECDSDNIDQIDGH